jgi:hypothetical protein
MLSLKDHVVNQIIMHIERVVKQPPFQQHNEPLLRSQPLLS